MRQSLSPKRPWLAALLGVLATGLGHAYLRRWRRALGWVVVLFATTALFVDPSAVDTAASGGAFEPLAVAPVLVVGGLSVVDAYVLAHAQNAMARLSPSPAGTRTHCPNCGQELDPDLDFCQWCSATLDGEDVQPAGSGEETGR